MIYWPASGKKSIKSIKEYYQNISGDLVSAGLNPAFLLFDIFINLPFGA